MCDKCGCETCRCSEPISSFDKWYVFWSYTGGVWMQEGPFDVYMDAKRAAEELHRKHLCMLFIGPQVFAITY